MDCQSGSQLIPDRSIKVYINWQHTEFGDPVLFRQPDLRQLIHQLL
jgi:phosphate-selective porin OprO/OprP